MSVAIVYICHNVETIKSVIDKGTYILFVGNNEITDEYISNPKIIIARSLRDHIESNAKLLTFTGWFAIARNNLFSSYEHICIIEYDLILNDSFIGDLTEILTESNPDVVSFENPISEFFLQDVKLEVIQDFLINKEIDKGITDGMIWHTSTNHCIRRSILCDFVDWYIPDCFMLSRSDYKNLSWYHERLFAVYLKYKNIDTTVLEGPIHQQLQSHYPTINNRISPKVNL